MDHEDDVFCRNRKTGWARPRYSMQANHLTFTWADFDQKGVFNNIINDRSDFKRREDDLRIFQVTS